MLDSQHSRYPKLQKLNLFHAPRNNSSVKKLRCYRLVKNDDMQGVQFRGDEPHTEHVALTRDEAQGGGSRFSAAVNHPQWEETRPACLRPRARLRELRGDRFEE